MNSIDCSKCSYIGSCCSEGVWVDLEEAKKIELIELQGQFSCLREDKEFPSGYKIATSHDDKPCTFLCVDGLCSIHKVNYELKPFYCKEFPYQDGKIENFAKQKCVQIR